MKTWLPVNAGHTSQHSMVLLTLQLPCTVVLLLSIIYLVCLREDLLAEMQPQIVIYVD